MLEKLKEDINDLFETMVTEHNDIFYKYEIDDDLKSARIYLVSTNVGDERKRDLRTEMIVRSQTLMGLYHTIKKGSSAALYTDLTYDLIYPDM